MNSPAACFNYFSPAQCFLSPPRPALHARLSRFSLDCVFSINRTGDRIFTGESAQEKYSSYRLVAHVFRYLRQKLIWQLTRSWQILFGRDGNQLLRRSPWGFDARGRLATPRIEKIEFQQTGKEPCPPLFYYRKLG